MSVWSERIELIRRAKNVSASMPRRLGNRETLPPLFFVCSRSMSAARIAAFAWASMSSARKISLTSGSMPLTFGFLWLFGRSIRQRPIASIASTTAPATKIAFLFLGRPGRFRFWRREDGRSTATQVRTVAIVLKAGSLSCRTPVAGARRGPAPASVRSRLVGIGDAEHVQRLSSAVNGSSILRFDFAG
jgi:hypothetical protein